MSTRRGLLKLPDHQRNRSKRRKIPRSKLPRSGWRCGLSTTQHQLTPHCVKTQRLLGFVAPGLFFAPTSKPMTGANNGTLWLQIGYRLWYSLLSVAMERTLISSMHSYCNSFCDTFMHVQCSLNCITGLLTGDGAHRRCLAQSSP